LPIFWLLQVVAVVVLILVQAQAAAVAVVVSGQVLTKLAVAEV
jgi:hypothetical protein